MNKQISKEVIRYRIEIVNRRFITSPNGTTKILYTFEVVGYYYGFRKVLKTIEQIGAVKNGNDKSNRYRAIAR